MASDLLPLKIGDAEKILASAAQHPFNVTDIIKSSMNSSPQASGRLILLERFLQHHTRVLFNRTIINICATAVLHRAEGQDC
jgi:hypothetical protein